MSIPVYKIQLSETRQAADTLYRAFQDDPMFMWFCDGPSKYEQVALALIETWVRYCVLYGFAYRTENFEAVALRKKLGDTKLSFWRMYRSGILKTRKILGPAGLKRMILLNKLLRKAATTNMHDQPYLYCWLLGTLPNKQRQGYGGALMKETFTLATRDNLPCYLEASVRAVKTHEHNGYRELSRVKLPESDIELVCMRREP